jgi:hypothetical protein
MRGKSTTKDPDQKGPDSGREATLALLSKGNYLGVCVPWKGPAIRFGAYLAANYLAPHCNRQYKKHYTVCVQVIRILYQHA